MATIKTLIGNVKGKDGGGYTEDILYEGDCSACISSNVIESSHPMMELSDSIEKYKSIRIEFTSHDTRNSSGGLVVTAATCSVNFIKSYYTYSCLGSSAGYGNNYSNQAFGFYDSKHLALCWENYSGWAHNMSHITVIGIRDKAQDTVSQNSNNYSIEETRIGTWIDGKPIYRKVVEYINFGKYSISDLNADTFINIIAVFDRQESEHRYVVAPYFQSSNDYWNYYLVDNDLVIRGSCSRPVISKVFRFIYEYTKTTD